MQAATFDVQGMIAVLEDQGVKKRLSQAPGVQAVEASYLSCTATVYFDETVISEAEIKALIDECGYHCTGLSQPKHICAPRALQRFADALDSSSRVQFHSFDVENVTVHENGGLASASYKLHLSVLRNGEVAFGAVITQNLALLRTVQGWKISGGDELQLSEVQGGVVQVGGQRGKVYTTSPARPTRRLVGACTCGACRGRSTGAQPACPQRELHPVQGQWPPVTAP